MSDSFASPAEGIAAGPQPSRRTIDAATRVFHWLLALCFTGAYLTADGERWRLVHVTLGYTMVGLIVFRLVWGLAGPRHARLSNWVTRAKAWPQFLRSMREFRPQWVSAQNVFNALAVLSLIALTVLTTASGYITYEELSGEWMEEVHETLGNAMLVIVLAHIGLLVGASVLRRRNLVMPMVSGRVEGRGPDLAQRNHAVLATVLLAGVLGFWGLQWMQAPAGGAGGGADTSAQRDGDGHDRGGHNGGQHDDEDEDDDD